MSECTTCLRVPRGCGEEVRTRIRDLAGAAGGSSPSEVQADELVVMLVHIMGQYDATLPHHGERTAVYTVALAEALGLPRAEVVALRRAALLHDLGRLLLPDALMRTTRPLTGEEYALVQSHPRAGAELLDPFPALRLPALWIAHHHERWDGWGYPYGLPAAFIPLGARILAVADTFDVLAGGARPGRPETMNPRSALRVLQACAGTQLDPDLVQRFVGLGWNHLETDHGPLRLPGP